MRPGDRRRKVDDPQTLEGVVHEILTGIELLCIAPRLPRSPETRTSLASGNAVKHDRLVFAAPAPVKYSIGDEPVNCRPVPSRDRRLFIHRPSRGPGKSAGGRNMAQSTPESALS